MTARDLVESSLRKLGVLAPGENAPASEATDGLAELNRMISSWSNERLLIFSRVEEFVKITVGQTDYTYGVGGDIDSSRPQWIDSAVIRDKTTTPNVDYPLRIYSLAEYSRLAVKKTTTIYPYAMYSDGAYPLMKLSLYPAPTAAHDLVLFTSKELSTIANLSTTLSFPPGYEDALLFNLSVRLSAEYGAQPSGAVSSLARESKAQLKRKNHRPRYLRTDPALVSDTRFNIYSGVTR